MGVLTYIPLLIAFLPGRELPVGTHLEIRLTCAIGTHASKPGWPVSAVLTTPVTIDDELFLPAGSKLTGQVKAVRRVGHGIVHETAALELMFERIILPDQTEYPISALVVEVDNARERVSGDGRILEQRSTSKLLNRTTGYVRLAAGTNIHVKTLRVDVPKADIYFSAGVELTLALGESLLLTPAQSDGTVRTLTDDERKELGAVAANTPGRTTSRSHHQADLINVMFVGTREQLSAAFLAAGWTETPHATLRSHLKNIRAVIENEGNRAAPMSTLLLDGELPDMMWQKGLNNVAKRHHIRIWKSKETWSGQEVWLGAATHDINFAYLRPGMPITHGIEERIDRERDKVVHDLEFAATVEAADWIDRIDVAHEIHNATGDRMSTDGRLAVIRLRVRLLDA